MDSRSVVDSVHLAAGPMRHCCAPLRAVVDSKSEQSSLIAQQCIFMDQTMQSF